VVRNHQISIFPHAKTLPNLYLKILFKYLKQLRLEAIPGYFWVGQNLS